MAPQPNYNQGVTDVGPDATPPGDYQNIRSSAASFGGGIAEGAQALGAGATKAATFYGQAAADDVSNNYQDFATKLLHGDPNKMVPGPDGQLMADTGYLGLRGRAALDQRPVVSQQLDEKLKELRGQLTSPEQQLQFDNFSRRYRSMVDERVGSHADGQATTWYQGVNTAGAKLSLDHISNNYNNPAEVGAGTVDLIHAYTKNAQLQGAQPGDPQFVEAETAARRDALEAQLNAVAVRNPAQAMALLEKNREIAGAKYDDMAAKFQGKAKQQTGYDVADQYIKKSYASNPAINPTVLTNAGAQYGVSGSYLMRVQQMETGSNPNQTSSTGAQGPFQFIPSTARHYGLKDPFNYQESADAAARFAADNRVSLTASLGRPPSDQELYLAHNQGAEGAALLLAHPNQRAGDLVGDRAIRVNGGDPNAPAASFTSMITGKFNNAPQAATASRKATVIGDILAIPEDQIDPDVRQHAIMHANQTLAAQQVAEEQDSKAKHEAQQDLQGKMIGDIIKGAGPEVISNIATAASSGQITGSQAAELYNFATSKGGVEDPLSNGPGYTDAANRLLLPPDDPSKITDVETVIRMRNQGSLTRKGADAIIKDMAEIRKNPDQAGVMTARASVLKAYEAKMGIDDEMSALSGKPFKNQKGLEVYNLKFVPAFESAYGAWTKSGKDPMDFFKDTKGLDAIMDSVYPPAQRAKDAISANGGPPVDKTVPPAPAGTDAKTWKGVISSPPVGVDGKQWTPTAFATAIDRLRANPTPDTKAAFNRWFGKAGFDADDILKKLPPPPPRESGPVGEPDVLPQEPGILTRLRESNRSALENMDKEPKDEGPSLLDRTAGFVAGLTRNKETKVTNPVAMGVRG